MVTSSDLLLKSIELASSGQLEGALYSFVMGILLGLVEQL